MFNPSCRINIALREEEGQLAKTVEDDGCGLPDDFRQREGMGLRIMQYRVRMIGGTLEIRNAPGGGTIVNCTVSLGRGQDQKWFGPKAVGKKIRESLDKPPSTSHCPVLP